MGIKDDLLESDAQFISFREAINIIAKAENCSLELAFNWFKDKGLFDEQIFLKREKNGFAITALYNYFYNADTGKIDYEEKHSENISELTAREQAKIYHTNLLRIFHFEVFRKFDDFIAPKNLDFTEIYGFARKRFYDLLTINKILIHPEQWKEAKSFLPDDKTILLIEDYLAVHNASSEQVLSDRCECKEKIAALEIQLLDAQANLLREKNLRELEKRNLVKQQKLDISGQQLIPAVGQPMHPRTANNAAKIIGALAEMNKLDLTQPQGQANKNIQAALEKLGCSLSKDTVGEWLKMANDQLR